MRMEAMSKPMALSHDIFPKVQPHIYTWINKYGKNFLYWNGVRAELVISEPELAEETMTPAIIASVETMMKKWKGQEELTCVFYIKIWKTADLLESEKLEKGIHDCVLEIVKKRENKFVSGEVDGFGNDFLGLLVNAFHHLNDKNMLSMEDLVDECKTFYFAGQETMTMIINETLRLYSQLLDLRTKMNETCNFLSFKARYLLYNNRIELEELKESKI
ncbi:cytochrome P450 CYP749A22-like [Gossypium hirsutum]|uniref:Cytochrome P450 CYP749A22-like n=1 Tax=Gossypium hirsutum TaxID=3635 RepID=A0A1U8M1N8_GOSHI|nr:cytochrome P450 CYP749A22-like [Gossypium hirsutum]